MPPMVRRLALSLFLALFFTLSWLALWTISLHLSHDGQQAVLLFPQGLLLALLILLPRRYWLTPVTGGSRHAAMACMTSNC
ncbi:sensory histidine kinase UhpB [Serratia fonticola]|uniref:Sensory histidine kinase UhpB n=1 Tax=Serratia fonticola TaxID=47917 RepID=A0A4V6KL83_SERFO|nr:sensory histidine kinase UhpB [Serratia fonticola]